MVKNKLILEKFSDKESFSNPTTTIHGNQFRRITFFKVL